jgi:hypothetical protein
MSAWGPPRPRLANGLSKGRHLPGLLPAARRADQKPSRILERLLGDDGNGRIIFAATRYRVARFLAGEHVVVRIDGDIVRIFQADDLIRAHPRRPPWRRRR